MKTITFKDTDETFEIMTQDERYIICQRPYTVAERDSEIKEWSDELNQNLDAEYIDDSRGFNTFDDFYEDCLEVEDIEREHRYQYGDCPEALSEDTIYYTVVDLQEQKRGDDSYVFSPHDYSKKQDCEEALLDLNDGEMELSRRNSIELSEYEIKE